MALGRASVPTVLVVQRRLTHYRVPFFEALRSEMDARGVRLVVAHGQATRLERSKEDAGVLSWALSLPTTYVGESICWQPFGALARASDLVVMTHENKLLYNLVAQYARRARRVALWGHGANLQGDASSLRERFKRATARQADWWFAYTEDTLPHLARAGFPRERTTVLNNAVDTRALRADLQALDGAEVAGLREELGLHGGPVGVFVGSLYADKRLDFLLEAASRVRQRVPGFQLVIAGAGPERQKIDDFCARHSWASYAGVCAGRRKAALLSLGRVFLHPGVVGLSILDAFAAEVPLVTTDCGRHGPEIAYLCNGANGVVTENNLEAFVEAAACILESPARHATLVAGCRAASDSFTVDGMARRFADGAERCLDLPILRRPVLNARPDAGRAGALAADECANAAAATPGARRLRP